MEQILSVRETYPTHNLPKQEEIFSLPFLDKKLYATEMQSDLQNRYEEEIDYNKKVLRQGIITLMLSREKMFSGEKVLSVDMDNQTFLRGMMESYVKLKNWGVDVNQVLNDYKHQRKDGVQVQLDDKEMEQIFRDLATRYLMVYDQKFSGNLDGVILEKYLAFLNAGTPPNPFINKTSFFPGKEKKYRQEQYRFDHKVKTDRDQKALMMTILTDDLLNYYILKNMIDSDFTTILTPQHCESRDYENMKMILDVYHMTTIYSTIQSLTDYLEYKKDPEAYRKSMPDGIDKKLKQKEMIMLDGDKKYLESLVVNLAKYYRLKCLYETKDNLTLTDSKNLEDNKRIEGLLLGFSSYFRYRKAHEKRLDF